MSDIPQPGSLDAEAGIFASAFDQTVRGEQNGVADCAGHAAHHRLRRQDGQGAHQASERSLTRQIYSEQT